MASRARAFKGSHQNRGKPNPCKVFVGNISFRVTYQELSQFFSKYGPVDYAQIVKDHQKQWSRGIGFVSFKNVESAQLALNAPEEDLILDDRVLQVSKPKRRALADELEGVGEDCEGVGGDCESVMGGDCEGVNEEDSSGVSPVNNNEENKFVSLNSDTLIHIFSFLCLKDKIRVERVCKSWQMATKLMWKANKSLNFRETFKSFSGKHSSLTDSILHSIFKRGCHGLLELDLSASPRNLTDFALDMIGMYCPRLEQLDLSGVSLTPTSLNLLTQRCSGLKRLRLVGCHQVGEKGLWWALHNCKSLESLDVSGNRRITGQCFYLAGLPAATQHAKVKGGEDGEDVEVKGCLKRLILEDCCSVKDEGILLLSQHKVPVLEVVNISKCQLLSGVAIRSVITSCRWLKELYFAGPNDNVKTADLDKIGSLNQLEVLVVDKHLAVGDSILTSLGKNCTRLRRLSCQACYDVTDVGVVSLASCTRLADLNISYCHQVTDAGLERLSEVGVLTGLTLRACLGLTDQGMGHLACHCLRLTDLDISGCFSLTNNTLYALQESLLHLRSDYRTFSIALGGTGIDGDVARVFAAATGSSCCLHDLSTHSLSADYDPWLNLAPLNESWDSDNEPSKEIPLLTSDPYEGFSSRPERDYLMDKVEDFLLADDPAIFSDEFSGGEDWQEDV